LKKKEKQEREKDKGKDDAYRKHPYGE